MQQPTPIRKLAAILAADMVGYSRLMEVDEPGTLARLRTHRLEVVDPAIAKSRGRIVKTTGDGMLVEFNSVVDAVQAAVEIQRRMNRRNSDVAPDRRIEFRIGINLGDVIVQEDDIFGDGVNIAARLQEFAEPGQICISYGVRDQLGLRMDVRFEDLGEQMLKNIARPIRAYRVLWDEAGPGPLPGPDGKAKSERPSIVVLPLTSMSGEQELFADGMTEDIITELSRFRELFVISRSSSFVFKGKSINLREVARELGVQFVLEGSVRRAGTRIRVTVQLIDAEHDRHVWAERFDREMEDVFAIQDELVASIVATLAGRVEAASRERAKNKPTENMAAYECVLAGKTLHHRRSPEANRHALQMLDRAIQLDPGYAHAHAWKACVLGQAWSNGWAKDRDATWKVVVGELETALSLDENDSDVHRILAAVNLVRGDHDQAHYHQNRALQLNPNDDLIVVQQGEILTWQGRAEEGIGWVQKAMRLNPYHPERFWMHLARAYYFAGRYGEAVEALHRISTLDVNQRALMVAAQAQLGDERAARTHAASLLECDRNFGICAHIASLYFKQADDREHLREALRKAGLPE
ncbi:MAG TPA: adenylate/guanylate cyclase domain-containing protein [Alphaproteobacteria bacterium]|nr:adenylate/guanylate cyclase domain-containing protein [Alphaproteobacteria bacterium]